MSKSHARQAGVLVVGRILAGLSESILLLLIVRLLGKADVGVLAALLVVYQTLTIVAASGFPSSLMYFSPTGSPAERRAITLHHVRVSMLLGAGVGLILVALGLVDLASPGFASGLTGGSASDDPVTLRYLLVMGPMAVFDLPPRILPNMLVIEGRAKAAAGVGVVKTLGTTVFTFVPIALGWDLWGIVGAMALWSVVYFGYMMRWVNRVFATAPRVPSPITHRELFRFTIPLGMTEVAGVLNNRLDRYLVIGGFGAIAVAEYSAGAWQIPFLVTIAYSVGAVYTPHFRQRFDEGRPGEVLRAWRASIEKVSPIVVPVSVGFLVAAEETVRLLFTEDYADATNVFRMYTLITLGRVTTFGNVLVAAGAPKLVMRATLWSLAWNLALSIPLLWAVGFLGPAIGTALAFVPMAATYCYYIGEVTGLGIRATFPLGRFLRVLLVSSLGAGAAVAFKLTVDAPDALMLAGELLITVAGFAAVGSLTGLISREDWAFLVQWARRNKPPEPAAPPSAPDTPPK